MAGGPRGQRGQSTVEAAILLPTVMVVLAVLMQPAILLYTRSVMSGAAAEAARLAVTAEEEERAELCRDYVLRRLEAVPAISIFHEGSAEDWEVETTVFGNTVSVEVAGRVRPLPLMAGIAGAVAERDGRGLVLRVSVERQMRASWVKGGYGDWTGVWG